MHTYIVLFKKITVHPHLTWNYYLKHKLHVLIKLVHPPTFPHLVLQCLCSLTCWYWDVDIFGEDNVPFPLTLRTFPGNDFSLAVTFSTSWPHHKRSCVDGFLNSKEKILNFSLTSVDIIEHLRTKYTGLTK